MNKHRKTDVKKSTSLPYVVEQKDEKGFNAKKHLKNHLRKTNIEKSTSNPSNMHFHP